MSLDLSFIPQPEQQTSRREEDTPNDTRDGGQPRKRRLLVYIIGCVFIVLLTFGYQVLFAERSFFPFANTPIFRALRSLARSGEITLQGERADRINVLLLGMGGAGHEGPYLTDTIILASIQPSTKKIALLSIPRDLVIPLGNYGWRKINTANAFGELEDPGNGALFVKNALEQLLQQPIHYYLRVDFNAFQKLIDAMGGIYLTVDNGFTDTRYPTDNFKYQTIRFDGGPQWFDGARALQFVRSRHGNNGEGSDFARARRQQKVIEAVKDRLFSVWTLTSPSVLSTLIDTFEHDVVVNMNLGEMVRAARLLKQIDTRTIETMVLDTSADGYLRETNFEGAFILEPRAENFDEIRDLLAHIFEKRVRTQKAIKRVTVDVRNGTKIEGLARRVANVLRQRGLIITTVANAPDQRITATFIIDQTDGKKDDALALLKATLGAGTVVVPLARATGATESQETFQSNADFIIILGPDQTTQIK